MLVRSALIATMLLAACSGSDKSGDRPSSSSPSPAPPDDEDTSIAEAIPVSFYDKQFFATVGGLFDLVIAGDVTDTPEPLASAEGDAQQRPFDFSASKNVSQLFLAQYRKRLDKISNGLSQLFGEGGPLAANGKAKLRIADGKGSGLFKTKLDDKEALIEVRIDRSAAEPEQLDIYALDSGEPVWNFGVRVLPAQDGKAPDVRYLGMTATEGKGGGPGQGGTEYHLNEFLMRPAYGEVVLARTRPTLEPPKVAERRSFARFKFDDDTLWLAAALQVDSGKTPGRIPGVADFLVAYEGNVVLHELVVARKGAPIYVQRSAFIEAATVTSGAGKLPVSSFQSSPLSKYGATALAETLGSPKRVPGCVNLGTRLTDAFKALTPSAALQARYDDAETIVDGGPANTCAASTSAATTAKHLDAICAFDGVSIKLSNAEQAIQGIDVCKDGWGSAVAGLRNPLVFDVKDDLRVQRLVKDGFYTTDLVDGAHVPLAAKLQASGTIDFPGLVESKVLFEVPKGDDLDAAKAAAL